MVDDSEKMAMREALLASSQEAARLREALEWYANEERYEYDYDGYCIGKCDTGVLVDRGENGPRRAEGRSPE